VSYASSSKPAFTHDNPRPSRRLFQLTCWPSFKASVNTYYTDRSCTKWYSSETNRCLTASPEATITSNTLLYLSVTQWMATTPDTTQDRRVTRKRRKTCGPLPIGGSSKTWSAAWGVSCVFEHLYLYRSHTLSGSHHSRRWSWQACLQLGRCDEIAEYSTTSKDDILRVLREGENLESYVERRPEVGQS